MTIHCSLRIWIWVKKLFLLISRHGEVRRGWFLWGCNTFSSFNYSYGFTPVNSTALQRVVSLCGGQKGWYLTPLKEWEGDGSRLNQLHKTDVTVWLQRDAKWCFMVHKYANKLRCAEFTHSEVRNEKMQTLQNKTTHWDRLWDSQM